MWKGTQGQIVKRNKEKIKNNKIEERLNILLVVCKKNIYLQPGLVVNVQVDCGTRRGV